MLILSLDMSGNADQEIDRYTLLMQYNLSPERIEELIPPYPADGPTVVSNLDLGLSSSNARDNTEGLRAEMERMRTEQANFRRSMESRRSSQSQSSHSQVSGDQDQTDEFTNQLVVGLERWLLPSKNMDMKKSRASNNWVISGSKTASGKPILANDPHLTLTSKSHSLLFFCSQ